MDTSQNLSIQQQISVMSPSEWEEFIEEWLSTKTDLYFDYERLGGAGDQGRDVVGYVDNPVESDTYVWDNYQCKHYSAPLSPSKIWEEIGKICYFSFLNKYPFPRKYYFIAPLGIGTKLSDLLKKPKLLQLQLLENWDKCCRDRISINKVELTDELKEYIISLDFSAFDKIIPIKLVIEHSKTRFHTTRFSVPLPNRPATPELPNKVEEKEITYVNKLILAYNSHAVEPIISVENANNVPIYRKHLKRSREDFAHAEMLRNFSRDNMPYGTFENIQAQVKSGICDILDSDYVNGFEKVKSAVSEARKLQLPSTSLTSCITVHDRGGICQQLANDDHEVLWCYYE
ncbi:ABC-three component system protein [Cobetia amphilecti]|uniref:ABC-three component system protein n=1 Tax=Cobetia amphilecti TaxID=1055104 RepID=UPI00329702AA